MPGLLLQSCDMRIVFRLAVLLLSVQMLTAQTVKRTGDISCKVAEECIPPKYPGGSEQLHTDLLEALTHITKGDCWPQGTALIQFDINTNGRPENIHLIKSVDRSFDSALIMAVQGLNSWQPAVYNHKKIKYSWVQPVRLAIDNNMPLAEVHAEIEIEIDRFSGSTNMFDSFPHLPQPFQHSNVDSAFFICSERDPVYPGGRTAYYKDLHNLITELSAELDSIPEGLVTVEFTIDNTGNAVNGKVLKSIGSAFDTVLLRMISRFKKWTPANLGNKPVSRVMRQSVKIVMEEEKTGDSLPEVSSTWGAKWTHERPIFYPNPVNDFIHIKNLVSRAKWKSARILSVSGVLIKICDISNKADLRIDVRLLPSGAYVLTVQAQDGTTITHRFMK